MKKLNGRKAVKIGVSILIALFIWLYVGIVDPTDITARAKDIPVEYLGENTTLANRGLMVVESSADTLNLKLKGTRSVISALDTKGIHVYVDLSDITATGTYTLGYDVSYPSNVPKNKITIESASAYTVSVTIGELYKKSVDVKYDITGTVPDGYLVQDPVDPISSLEIHGQQADIIKVSYAKVSYDVTDLTSSVNEMVAIQYYDSGNNQLDGTKIYANVEKLQLTIPIYKTKEVKLTTQLSESAGLKQDSVLVSIQPSALLIAGEYYLVEDMTELVVADIDLANVTGSTSTTYPLKLPDGIVSVDGVTEVIVSITLKNTAARSFTATNFNTENVAGGLTAVVLTESLSVTLRGQTADLDDADAGRISVVADLSGITTAGTYSVPAVVQYTGSADIGVVGSYQVSVQVDEDGTGG